MSEWTVVTVLVSLTGLAAAVLRPLIGLNSSLTKMNQMLSNLEASVEKLTEKNNEAHDKIWDRIEKDENMLYDHEKRLYLSELTGEKNKTGDFTLRS